MNVRLMLQPSSGTPASVVNTSPESFHRSPAIKRSWSWRARCLRRAAMTMRRSRIVRRLRVDFGSPNRGCFPPRSSVCRTDSLPASRFTGVESAFRYFGGSSSASSSTTRRWRSRRCWLMKPNSKSAPSYVPLDKALRERLQTDAPCASDCGGLARVPGQRGPHLLPHRRQAPVQKRRRLGHRPVLALQRRQHVERVEDLRASAERTAMLRHHVGADRDRHPVVIQLHPYRPVGTADLGPLTHPDHLRVLLAMSTRRPCLVSSIHRHRTANS